jgi:hypothetical protein
MASARAGPGDDGAGVPLKAHVAGVDGLIRKATSCGADRHPRRGSPGDMDFKVAGRDRCYALQMDIKIEGITREIMQVALAQAKEARMHILQKMQDAIGASRGELSAFAPRMIKMKINPEKIRDVIGKGGAVIRALTEETGTQIDIEDDGTIIIASVIKKSKKPSAASGTDGEVEVGKIYDGTVLRLLDFSAIVNCCRAGRPAYFPDCQRASMRSWLSEGKGREGQGHRSRREGSRATVHEGGRGQRSGAGRGTGATTAAWRLSGRRFGALFAFRKPIRYAVLSASDRACMIRVWKPARCVRGITAVDDADTG